MFGLNRLRRSNSLEDAQKVHNSHLAGQQNISASNDPHQIPNDATEVLIKGAEAVSAGKTLGLSEEETLAAVSRQNRRQQQRASHASRADRQRAWAQNQNTLSDEGLTEEIKGVSYLDEDFSDPMGQDQSAFQSWGGGDLSKGRDERLRQGYIDREDMSEAETAEWADATSRPPSGTAGVRDALAELRKGTERFGYDWLDGSADVESRLADSVAYGPEQRAIERATAQRLIDSENERLRTPGGREVAENNAWRAQAEADVLGMGYTVNGPGAFADENIGNIGEIQQLGKANSILDIRETRPRPMEGFAELSLTPDAPPTYIDPVTRGPLGQYGPEPVNLSAGQDLNAPAPMNTTAWTAQTMPGWIQGARSFGDYPQVDINSATSLFSQRLEETGLPGTQGVSGNVRGVEEMQRAIDLVRREGAKRGDRFNDVNAEGQRVETTQPSVEAVLNSMRYTPQEAQQLAQAMFQMEAAKRSGVSGQGKQQYYTRTGPMGSMERVTFGAAEAMSPRDGAAQIARIPRTATQNKRDEAGDIVLNSRGNPQKVQIGERFKTLPSPGARSQNIGAVVGNERPIIRSTMSGAEPVDAVGMRTMRAERYNPPKEAGGIVRRNLGSRTPSDSRRQHEADYTQRTRDLQVKNLVAEQRGKRADSRRAQMAANVTPGGRRAASENAAIDRRRATTQPSQGGARMSPQARIEMMRERREAERRAGGRVDPRNFGV